MSESSDNSINLERINEIVIETSNRDMRLNNKISCLKGRVNKSSGKDKKMIKPSFIDKTKTTTFEAVEKIKEKLLSNKLIIYIIPIIVSIIFLYFLKPPFIMKEYIRNRKNYQELDKNLLISSSLFIGVFIDVLLFSYLKSCQIKKVV
jgi:hypothetical protein